MQMLHAGGYPILCDEQRAPDADNPRGYFEFDKVRALERDATWMATAEGKAIKVVSPLLRSLPANHEYRVIFMRREVCQVVASQLRMLRNLGRENEAPAEAILLAAMRQELVVADQWIAHHAESVIDIDYLATRQSPSATDERLAAFLPGLDAKQAGLAVVPHPLFIRRHPLICGTPK